MKPQIDHQSDAKDRLLEAGATLFAEKGFAGASVREICDLAGTGNNMIHYYFGNKQALYDSLIERFSAEVFRTPMRIIEKEPQTRAEFVSRFELFVEETLEAIINNRLSYAIASRDEVTPKKGPFEAYSANFIKFINHGRKKGFVNEDIDAAMLTGLILDRLGNQVLSANWIKKTSGVDVVSDAVYKAKWLRANLDLFLHGFLK